MIQNSKEILEKFTASLQEVTAKVRDLTASYARLVEACKQSPEYTEALSDVFLDTQTSFADLGVASIDACTEASEAMRVSYTKSMAA
jgi:hypothetical protein